MTSVPQALRYRPDPVIGEIADFLADPVAAAAFPEAILRFRNDRHAATIGLETLDDSAWIDHFGRFTPLTDNLPQPLALRYHGHQFRVYNPDIGDGRGFLFAQLRDDRGRVLDLGTKGSGQTPYSRFGDGRLTLKGAVREILATEMLEALGVETSKTLSVIETGEALQRGDEPSPTRSAVLVRLNHGHIRIGSFQRLATLGETDNLKQLVAYALRHYHGQQDGNAALLVRLVAEKTAQLAAQFMAAGFVHGVLNTDNINISGESFDYGPWRWTPTFDPGFTAAYFDHQGLYAFGRQPEAIQWTVMQLAIALRSIAQEDALVEAVNAFAPAYFSELGLAMTARLGLVSAGGEQDGALVRLMETALIESGVSYDHFFFDWRGGALRQTDRDGRYAHPAFAPLKVALSEYRASGDLAHPYWSDEAPCSMLIDEVESLWEPITASDDWRALYSKITAIRRMGEAMVSAGQ